MKKAIMILISVFCLTACYSTTPLTFEGNTSHWQIEMNVTNPSGSSKKQKVNVIYNFKGSLLQLKKYKHLELSFKTSAKSGSETIYSKNGLSKRQFTVTIGGNGSNITKDTKVTAAIVLGKNEIKETTKLVNK